MTKTGSLFHGLAFSASLLLVACTEPAAPAVVEPTPPAAASEALMPMDAPSQQPGMDTPVPMTAQLNPPHGEPGHDCAIPVGAPLDGSGNAGNNAAMQMPPATAPMPPASPISGMGKINPAHGEPGHDCAVPVGSPLPG
ncbi:MAG: hypothetical protein ACOH13_01160 [Flavobacteriales bacterium]